MIGRKRLFRLHQAVGVAAAAVLVLTALTGALLVLRGYLGHGPPPAAPATERPLGLEALLARAAAVGPDEPVTDIALPNGPTRPYEFFFDDDAETVVYLAGDGSLVGTRATAGGLTRWLFRLHTGEIAGAPGEALVFTAGAALLALTASGLLMIAARRRARRS